LSDPDPLTGSYTDEQPPAKSQYDFSGDLSVPRASVWLNDCYVSAA
jgi:hypothetical protein